VVLVEQRKAGGASVYRVIGVIGTSATSWEAAAAEAIRTAGGSMHDLRVAEVTKQDVVVGDAGELLYRTRIPAVVQVQAGVRICSSAKDRAFRRKPVIDHEVHIECPRPRPAGR
jgi:flavin-binding protein dodecin